MISATVSVDTETPIDFGFETLKKPIKSVMYRSYNSLRWLSEQHNYRMGKMFLNSLFIFLRDGWESVNRGFFNLVFWEMNIEGDFICSKGTRQRQCRIGC